MTDTPELNVWERAFSAWDDAPTNPSRIGDAERDAAAVIRTYGDQRHQAAIDDVVKWLGECQQESITGHVLAGAAQEITRRFGKG